MISKHWIICFYFLMMLQKVLIEKNIKISPQINRRSLFFEVLNVYLTKQNVVNRKLSGITNFFFGKVKKSEIEGILDKLRETLEFPKEFWNEACNRDEILLGTEDHEGFYVSLDRLIPRSTKFENSHVLTAFDLSESSALFISLETNFRYQIYLENDILKILVDSESDSNWLKFVLAEKFQNWLENCEVSETKNLKSIHLINAEEYQKFYSELKDKYGSKMVEMWPENTDPLKFVYEDLSIAAYLILLWKKLAKPEGRDEKQSFVDLGCGNGLLVYILAMEGHPGFGIDLRRRKIWDYYPKTVDLREQSIIPSDKFLFPETDWIIGNHSDELSPWIPIIAARSSYSTNFFLLPCCSFELDGKKYARKTCKRSQYLEYIDFLTDITKVCKFQEIQIDRLKIPSTKRICLIGTNRCFPESDFNEISSEIQDFIDARCSSNPGDSWASDFKARESIEKVKNCTTVDKSISLEIVKTVFHKILEKSVRDDWNSGGELAIPEAVALINKEKLQELKSECGGIQTLLRNYHQVFQVNQGKIKIRAPEKLSEKKFSKAHKKNEQVKSKPCFFHQYHPQGCPLNDTDCCYIH